MLGLVIVALILLDVLALDGVAMMFLLRRMAVLVDWVAFWR